MQGLWALGDAPTGQSSASHVLYRQAEIRMNRIEQSHETGWEVHTFLLRTPSPKRSLLMRRMLTVVLLTALSLPLAAHTKIETICGHVGVQSGKDISMTTDEGKKLMVVSDDSASEERLLKARPDQRVCATGTLTPTSITAEIVTYW